jgi:hypothetical protein
MNHRGACPVSHGHMSTSCIGVQHVAMFGQLSVDQVSKWRLPPRSRSGSRRRPWVQGRSV